MLAGNPITTKPEPAMKINLAGLPAAMRKPIWNWMLKHRPAVCEWLGGEQCKMIREGMNAAPVLDLNQADLNQAETDDLMRLIPGLSRYAI